MADKPNSELVKGSHIEAFPRDRFRDQGVALPDQQTSMEETLTWLAENNYVPVCLSSGVHLGEPRIIFRKIGTLNHFFLNSSLSSFLGNAIDDSYTPTYSYKTHQYFYDRTIKFTQSPKPSMEETSEKTTSLVEGISNSENIDSQHALKPFPVDSLEVILEFIRDIDLVKTIKVVGENTKNANDSGIANMFSYVGFKLDDANPIVKLVKRNSSINQIKTIFSQVFSYGTLNEYYNFYQGNLEDAGQLGKVMLSKASLQEYFNSFGDNKITLLLSVLQDRNLYNLLNNEEDYKTISDLVFSLGIKSLDEVKIRALFVSFKNLHEFILTHSKDTPITELAQLQVLLQNNLKETLYLMKSFNELLIQLEPLISVFITSSPYPIQCLLNSKNSISVKEYSLSPGKKNSFLDCKSIFEQYSDESLGNYSDLITAFIVSTTLKDKIVNRNLDGFVFNSLNEEDPPINTIQTSFENCAFEDFSFGSEFHNFNFNQVYLRACDFSNAKFSGVINLDKTFMDKETFISFKNALIRSCNNSENKPTVNGLRGISLMGTNEKVIIDNQLEIALALKSFQKPIHHGGVEATVDPEALPQDQSQGYINQSYGAAKGAVGVAYNAAGYVASSLTSLFWGNEQICSEESAEEKDIEDINQTNAPRRTADDIHNDTLNDQTNYFNNESIAENYKRKIEAEILKLRKDLNSIQGTSSDSKTIDQLKTVLSDQQQQLKDLNYLLDVNRRGRIAKEKIATEQRLLLKNETIKAYYQTLLSNLCATLQSIILLNISTSLLKREESKVTSISNKGDRSRQIIDAKQSRLRSLGNLISSAGSHAVEALNLLKPLIAIVSKPLDVLPTSAKAAIVTALGGGVGLPVEAGIEAALGAASGIIKQIIKTHDQSKIDNTVDPLRGLTPKKLEIIADEIARKISFSYEEQILVLTKESAIKFAVSACECITAALFNGQIKNQEDLSTYAWLSVRKLESSHNAKIPLIEIRMPFTKEELTGVDNKKYTASDLYRCSPITYCDSDGKWIKCAVKKNERPEKNKWFRVTTEELEKYFPDYVEDISSEKSCDVEEPKVIQIGKLGDQNQNHLIANLREDLVIAQQKYQDEQVKLEQENREWKLKCNKNKEDFEIEIDRINKVMNQILNIDPTDINQSSQDPTISKKTAQKDWVARPLSGPPQKAIINKVPNGLINITNSCYMNASLQVMFNIPSICERILDVDFIINGLAPTAKDYNDDLKKKAELKKSLNKLFVNRDSGSSLEEMLKNVRTTYFNLKNKQNMYDQQDAQEFLQEILDVIDWKLIQTQPRLKGKTVDGLQIPYIDIGIPANNSMLQVSIKNEKDSFQKIIQNHFNVQEGGSRKIREIEYVSSEEQVFMLNEPEYILVQLKRFESNQEKSRKIHAPIEFPVDQKVKIPCGIECKFIDYQIISMINHSGVSLTNGHYTALIKNNVGSGWYECNDSTINKLNNMPRAIESQSYIIVLKRVV